MAQKGSNFSTTSPIIVIFWIFLNSSWRQWQPTLVLLPGKSQGRQNLVDCRLWGHTELDTIERLHLHFSLSCIGEGNGNPLQCSCLENPRDEGAWWAAVYGVTQSRTPLKRLSSSSSSSSHSNNCEMALIYLIFIYLYFWLCWGFVAAHGRSLVAARGLLSSSGV